MRRITERSMRLLTPLLVSVLLLLSAACRKSPDPAAPSALPVAQVVALNEITVFALDDCMIMLPLTIFPNLNKRPDVEAPARNGDAFRTPVRTYLIRSGERVILVDAGKGAEAGVHGRTRELLAANGVWPEDMTDVLLTHLDEDHIRGLIHQGRPVYPKAALRLSKPEYERWIVQGADREPEYIALARQVMAAYKGRVELFEQGKAVLPGITPIDAGGHTAGHTGYDVTSGDKGLTIVGDLLHVASTQLRHPDCSPVFDADPARAAAARERILARLSSGDRLIAGMHFSQIGNVRRAPAGGYLIVAD